MTPTEPSGGSRVALYVRETLPEPAQQRAERVVTRLEGLANDDRIDGYDVFHWPKRIRCDEADCVSGARYNEFVRWAQDSGVALTPFFETRDCYSMATAERGEWLVFPALCLVVYENGEMASVFPHADADSYRSVVDCLDALAATATDSSESTETGEHASIGTAG